MNNKNTSMLCDPDSSALLVIDVQTHLTAIMPAKVLARLQRNMGLLLTAARLYEIPVFATEQYPQGLGNLEEEIAKLLPEGSHRYEKTSFSCTGADNFSADLKASGRKQIILAGMEAHICVIQTAIDLVKDGYQVFVAADAICSRHRESYETALLRLRYSDVTVLDAESVLFEWMRDAKNEHFKTLQTLLR
jgi:nicotinamidase-related amidase